MFAVENSMKNKDIPRKEATQRYHVPPHEISKFPNLSLITERNCLFLQ